MPHAKYRCGATCTTGYQTGKPCRRAVAIEGNHCPHHRETSVEVERIGYKRYLISDEHETIEVAEEYGMLKLYHMYPSGVTLSQMEFSPGLAVSLARVLRTVQLG